MNVKYCCASVKNSLCRREQRQQQQQWQRGIDERRPLFSKSGPTAAPRSGGRPVAQWPSDVGPARTALDMNVHLTSPRVPAVWCSMPRAFRTADGRRGRRAGAAAAPRRRRAPPAAALWRRSLRCRRHVGCVRGHETHRRSVRFAVAWCGCAAGRINVWVAAGGLGRPVWTARQCSTEFPCAVIMDLVLPCLCTRSDDTIVCVHKWVIIFWH